MGRRYNFGLTCVDSEGSTTRHLFGVNSFDPEETFDTLVRTQLDWGRGRGRMRSVGIRSSSIEQCSCALPSIDKQSGRLWSCDDPAGKRNED